MPAPLGNQNGAKGKRWRDAIDRALVRAGGGKNPYDNVPAKPEMKAMDDLADIFVKQVQSGDLGFFKEFGDRLDGRAAQQVLIGGDGSGEPVVVEVVRFADKTA